MNKSLLFMFCVVTSLNCMQSDESSALIDSLEFAALLEYSGRVMHDRPTPTQLIEPEDFKAPADTLNYNVLPNFSRQNDFYNSTQNKKSIIFFIEKIRNTIAKNLKKEPQKAYCYEPDCTLNQKSHGGHCNERSLSAHLATYSQKMKRKNSFTLYNCPFCKDKDGRNATTYISKIIAHLQLKHPENLKEILK